MGPSLSEADARTLTRHIVTEIRQMGGHVTDFGVDLGREGFCFLAVIGGRTVWVYRGQGNFQYRDVARDLLASALDPSRDAGGEFLPPEKPSEAVLAAYRDASNGTA
jgi:hypothetical protein